jgi:ERCC4-type nuclease
VVLLVDNREPLDLRTAIKESIPQAQVERMAASDYLIFDEDGHSIGIERKEIKDLINSISQRKLKRQLESLSQFDRGILLIEGHWNVERDGSLCVHNKRSGWTPQSIQAILLALQEQTGVKVLHTANYNDTILTLRMLERRGEAGCFWHEGKTDEQRAA